MREIESGFAGAGEDTYSESDGEATTTLNIIAMLSKWETLFSASIIAALAPASLDFKAFYTTRLEKWCLHSSSEHAEVSLVFL